MSHKSEQQWEYVTCTKQDGRVYRSGNKFKYIDKGLEDLDAFIISETERINNRSNVSS